MTSLLQSETKVKYQQLCEWELISNYLLDLDI